MGMGRFDGTQRRVNRPLHGLAGGGVLVGVKYHSDTEEVVTQEAFRCVLP